MEVWKEYTRWKADDMPESTYAIVLVSNFGNVKRLPYKRWCVVNNNYSFLKEKIYTLLSNRGKQKYEINRPEKYGKYLHVCVNKKSIPVHRMVAECFIPNPLGLPQVNHIDENRSNNYYENLEWVTNKQNFEKRSNELKKNTYAKLIRFSDEDCIEALNMRLSGVPTTEICKKYNLSHETVRARTDEIATEEQKKKIKDIQRKNGDRKRLETMRLRGIIK